MSTSGSAKTKRGSIPAFQTTVAEDVAELREICGFFDRLYKPIDADDSESDQMKTNISGAQIATRIDGLPGVELENSRGVDVECKRLIIDTLLKRGCAPFERSNSKISQPLDTISNEATTDACGSPNTSLEPSNGGNSQ
jgi:hypothetical protein